MREHLVVMDSILYVFLSYLFNRTINIVIKSSLCSIPDYYIFLYSRRHRAYRTGSRLLKRRKAIGVLNNSVKKSNTLSRLAHKNKILLKARWRFLHDLLPPAWLTLNYQKLIDFVFRNFYQISLHKIKIVRSINLREPWILFYLYTSGS